MQISSFKIRNFRSIDNNGVEIQSGSIAAFVGCNSAGKSSILEALNYFFNDVTCENSDFWFEHTENPIEISVRFSLDEKEKSMKFLKHSYDGSSIVCKRKIQLNAGKGKYEFIGQWIYTGENALNPWPDRKPTINNIHEYLHQQCTEELRRQNGWTEDTPMDVDIYLNGLGKYWLSRFERMPKNWNDDPVEDKEIVNNFPSYFYLPVEYTISDEIRLTKTSRFQQIYSKIVGDIQELLTDAKIESVKKSLKTIYKRHGFDKRLEETNKILQNVEITASAIPFRLEFAEPDVNILFKREPEIKVDDGYDSTIQKKGHGMQRDAVFRLLQTYLKLCKGKNVSFILAVDEPELYMHPTYKRALYASFLDFAHDGCQVFYTTHDPSFISVNRFDDIHIVRRDVFSATKVSEYSMMSLKSTQNIQRYFVKNISTLKDETIRTKLEHLCHGNQNEGFLADKIILVEGDTEQYAIPQYFKHLGFDLDINNTAIIQTGSVNQVGILCTIFSAFGIPCYCIFDGDKPKEADYALFLKHLRGEHIRGNEKDQLKTILEKFKTRKNIINFISGEQIEDFPQTSINDNYTVWETDFETTIHKTMQNYEIIKKSMDKTIDNSKPLTAYYIAKKACQNEEIMPEETWTIWRNIIDKVRNMHCINLLVAEEDHPNNTIQVVNEPNEHTLPIIPSADGRETYFTPDMAHDYAMGNFPIEADCIIHIQGNSMEPIIPDNSYIAAKYNNENPIGGRTYICCIDGGEMVCKQYIEHGHIKMLKSLNPDAENINIEEGMSVIFQCIVLCSDRHNRQPYIYLTN